MEIANPPKTSVTFGRLAWSGAKITDGLLGPYEGQAPLGPGGTFPLDNCPRGDLYETTFWDGTPTKRCTLFDPSPHFCRDLVVAILCEELLSPQIDQLVLLLCPTSLSVDIWGRVSTPGGLCPVAQRNVDLLIVSAGINDLRFSKVVKACSALRHCQDLETGGWETLVNDLIRDVQGVGSSLWQLPPLYDSLNDSLLRRLGVPPNMVFFTEYPDITRDPSGNFCHMLPEVKDFADDFFANLADILNLASVELDGFTPDESEWAYSNFLIPLNTLAYEAAVKHGWFYVGGVMAAFNGHGQCAGDQKWVNGLASSHDTQGNLDGTLHPNVAGHIAIANRLDYFISQRPPRGFTAMNRIELSGETIESVEGPSGWLTGRCLLTPPDQAQCDSDSAAVSVRVSDYVDLAINLRPQFTSLHMFDGASPNDTAFATGDVTGDGAPEVVVADGDALGIYDPTGARLTSMPVESAVLGGRSAVGPVMEDPSGAAGLAQVVLVDQ